MDHGGRFAGVGKNVVIALSLVAAGFFGAWLRFRPHLGSTGTFTDGIHQYEGAGDEPIRYAVWESPAALAGEVNTGEGEHAPSISPDGQWIVFSVGERGDNSELWIAELEGETTHSARPLYELNSAFDELAPAFSEGGLWFATNRPGGEGGFDLWRADFERGEFGEPQLLDASINTSRDELDPAPLPGGTAVAFASNRDTRGRTGCDFYLARPGEDQTWVVEPLDELNSTRDDRELCFTGDGRRVVFASDRDGERGDFDLFRSLSERGAWLAPSPIAGLDSERVERGPALAGDGFTLWLEMSGPEAPADLYRARSLELFQRPGPRVGWLDLVILTVLLLLALLAFLAKKWETLEVLYKCFLVSVIAHLFLLWWFRTIHPENEVLPLEAGSPSFQVQLAASPRSADSASAERGGELSSRRSEPEASESTPERRSTSSPSFQEAAVTAPRTTLARSESPAALLPAPDSSVARPDSELAETPAVHLADAANSEPLYRERGPSMEIAAQDIAAVEAREVGDLAAPSRAESNGRSTQASAEVRRAPQKQARREAVAMPAGASIASARPNLDSSPAATTPTRQPMESFQRVATPAESLALETRSAETVRSSALESLQRAPERTPTAAAFTLPAPTPRSLTTAALARSESVLEGPRRVQATLSPTATAQAPTSELREPTRAENPLTRPVALSGTSKSLELAAPTSTARPNGRAGPDAPRRWKGPSSVPDATPVAHSIVADKRREADQPLETTRFEHTPYAARFGPAKARALEEFGGSTETEAAVAAGLAYLARTQRPEGFWGDPRHEDDKYGYVLVGKSGLALLAFLGAGHTHQSDTEHSAVVQRTIDFLLAVQGETSGHFGATSAYSHGISTYALAETYAVTGDPRLAEPLERAVAQILRHQNDRRRDARRFGGWSYYYSGSRRVDSWPRVSISAWQVMALRSAELGGLEVPARAFEDARAFLIGALDERRGSFRYSHDPDRLRGPYAILPGSTPAALFALHLLGEDLAEERFREPLSFVLQRAPSGYRYTGDDDFVSRARGNLYFWYYGSLAMMKRGGNSWKRWNTAMKETLLEAQRDDGSWAPISAYSRYANDTDRSAIYSTAMCVLSLEVYYRYFTPLLDAVAEER